MPVTFRERLNSPEGRTSIFYLTLFMAMGISNPYLPIWLVDKGISESAIGTISAAPILVVVVLSMLVGRIADRAKDWRTVIVAGAVFAGGVPLGLYFVDGYWGVLIVWTAMMVPFQAIAPVVDAAALRMTRRHGTDFGRVRVWGTIGFILATIIGGFFLGWYGAAAFVTMIVVLSLARAATALQLPYFREENDPFRAPPALAIPESVPGDVPLPLPPPPSPARGRRARANPKIATTMKQTWQLWYVLPLVGVALLHGSHMLQMGFGALIWQRAGIPPEIIGPLWAVAPTSEIVIMLYFARVARRFSARHLLLFCCAAGVVRWCGFALEPGVWGLAALQALNLATMGMSFLGAVNFIANWTSEEITAESQSVAVVFRQITSVAVLVGSGFLVAWFGAGAFWASAALAALAGLCIIGSLILMPPSEEQAAVNATHPKGDPK